ncbi:phage portal protein [Lactiplantibacillus plantarum]|uniref:Phage portal protein n=1 Tax=Lactiplantibacillus plantarum TaxID=1590 RepID=A0AAX1K7P9_LACPN|nr:phage portal protein [Lactiplantibacillus plantarum]QQM60574.1 phage portal protein [Lactiplantibacillus plantarum]WEZ93677.1 phage portal protein [Lactiplantibacillus plantarum]
MSVINSFFDLFTRRKDSSFIYDLDLFQDIKNRAYLKRMAIDTVINYVGRAVSQSEFRVMNKGLPVKDAMYYKLNVRPNTDESASDFWQHFIYQLIYYNEVLVIQDDDSDLLIADDFSRHEYTVYEDIFDNVTVKEYTFKRSFPMSDVIYLRYSNEQLEHYLTGLWGDYGELFGRMYELELRNNQIRATVKADLTAGVNDGKANKLQKFIDKIFQSFSKNSVALVPITNGFEYNEVSNGVGKNQTFDESNGVLLAFIDHVARLVGVPPALIHGETAESGENQKMFNKQCLSSLLNKIQSELNAKSFSQRDYLKNGKQVEVIGINRPTLIELAEQIDKLGSSGMVTQNEVRSAVGLPPREDGDQIVMTKNYTTKGGDNNEED